MDPNYMHLFMNHVPVLGSIIATGVLIFGLLRKQEEIVRLSLYLFIFSALAAFPVYFSGEGAEEGVEHLQGVSESLIEKHEDLAKIAIFLIEGLGLAAIGGLILSFRRARLPQFNGIKAADTVDTIILPYKQSRLPLWYASTLCGLALLNCGVMAQTAHLGGQIRHSEIRQGTQAEVGKSGEAGETGESEADEAREKAAKGEIAGADQDDRSNPGKSGSSAQSAATLNPAQAGRVESEARERSESGSVKSEAGERNEKAEVSETRERSESGSVKSEAGERNEKAEVSETRERKESEVSGNEARESAEGQEENEKEEREERK